jgi:hypothetical protein
MVAVLEDGDNGLFHYCPAALKFSNRDETLNRELVVDILDLGDVIRRQFKFIEQKNKISVRPKLIYRAYRSDDLDSPMVGPVEYEVQGVSFNLAGATLSASSRTLNNSKTGIIYNTAILPSMRKFYEE